MEKWKAENGKPPTKEQIENMSNAEYAEWFDLRRAFSGHDSSEGHEIDQTTGKKYYVRRLYGEEIERIELKKGDGSALKPFEPREPENETL